jgi:hypothetical protein
MHNETMQWFNFQTSLPICAFISTDGVSLSELNSTASFSSSSIPELLPLLCLVSCSLLGMSEFDFGEAGVISQHNSL